MNQNTSTPEFLVKSPCRCTPVAASNLHLSARWVETTEPNCGEAIPSQRVCKHAEPLLWEVTEFMVQRTKFFSGRIYIRVHVSYF